MASSTKLSPDFERQMKEQLGSAYLDFSRSLEVPSPVSIRLNPGKIHCYSGTPVPWCSTGYYLPERPVFTLDPLFHAGTYYVQEASSMFLEQVVIQAGLTKKPLRVLDLCAAPGGKSTHLLSLLHPESLVVANETIRARASILCENLQKWGCPNTVVTANDPHDFKPLPGFFDVILVDAPCSGEGLFRKDEHARNEWSPAHVQFCCRRQQRILEDVWSSLKENGILIYSTCTYNELENETTLSRVMEHFSTEPIELKADKKWNLVKSSGPGSGYRFYPHRVDGEGLFIAALRKTDRHPETRIKIKEHLPAARHELKARLANWLDVPDQFYFFHHRHTTGFLPLPLQQDVQFLMQHLHVLQAGTPLATVKQDKLIPEPAAALSVHVNKRAFPSLELQPVEALNYLRKEAVQSQPGLSGFALVTHKNIPLGWVNALHNRVNNLYPSAWRIRMQGKFAFSAFH